MVRFFGAETDYVTKILGANTQLLLVRQTTKHLNLEGNICYKHRLGVIQYLTQEGTSIGGAAAAAAAGEKSGG